jgi:hypothetical protein
LAENFVRGGDEIGIRGILGIRTRRSDGSLLCLDAEIAKEQSEADE